MLKRMDQVPPSHANSIGNPSQITDDQKWFDVDGNKLKLIREGSARLKALTDIIEQAKKSLSLCFYMFEDDAVGTLIRNMLIKLCKRGVSVELIIDSFGSNGAPTGFFDPFIQAGGQFAIFSPRFSTSYFVRNHQKIVIADNSRAMIGGFNITDEYFDRQSGLENSTVDETSWEDLGVVIHGPEVRNLADYFEKLSGWVHQNNGNIRLLQKMVRGWDAGDGNFRWLLGGPSNRLSRWAAAVKKDLETGEQLDLVSAYFSPGQGLLRRIARLSKRGGRNRLILAGKTDNGATIGASRLLYGYLLKRGACIYEYQPRRLHTKMIIIDDSVYIGSANFDLRSLFINVEIMVRIEDEAFADHARLLVDNICGDALPISKQLHKARRGWINRLRWTLSYFVVNILDYSVTRRFNFGVKK
ncbi:MAG: phosphatidylserine/phosphatidylglycerophosphate/cardiolipin synthase family protein [Parasphingorhabdus sp.]|uniref:phospholipase D-like domain-containing protein n=1 Tax=Parasphingorhabdus sp. TaxID=2709688 RepID=UPI003299F693